MVVLTSRYSNCVAVNFLHKLNKMSLSPAALTILEGIKTRLTSGNKPENEHDEDIVQYNVTLNGNIVKSFVVNLKEYTYADGAGHNDVEITIDDNDVAPAFSGKALLEDLLSQGKIKVVGNVALLKQLDARTKRRIAAAAAQQK